MFYTQIHTEVTFSNWFYNELKPAVYGHKEFLFVPGVREVFEVNQTFSEAVSAVYAKLDYTNKFTFEQALIATLDREFEATLGALTLVLLDVVALVPIRSAQDVLCKFAKLLRTDLQLKASFEDRAQAHEKALIAALRGVDSTLRGPDALRAFLSPENKFPVAFAVEAIVMLSLYHPLSVHKEFVLLRPFLLEHFRISESRGNEGVRRRCAQRIFENVTLKNFLEVVEILELPENQVYSADENDDWWFLKALFGGENPILEFKATKSGSKGVCWSVKPEDVELLKVPSIRTIQMYVYVKMINSNPKEIAYLYNFGATGQEVDEITESVSSRLKRPINNFVDEVGR
jgi:hypothetical protein